MVFSHEKLDVHRSKELLDRIVVMLTKVGRRACGVREKGPECRADRDGEADSEW